MLAVDPMAMPPRLPLARLSCMSTSPAEWVTAAATCVLGIGGIGAFVYAARTYGAQNAQLQLAKQDSMRLRTPVLRGEVSAIGQGVPNFRLDVRLSTPEPLARLRVIIDEARANDCPLGFTPGQTGVPAGTRCCCPAAPPLGKWLSGATRTGHLQAQTPARCCCGPNARRHPAVSPGEFRFSSP